MLPSDDDINLEYMCGESCILVTWNVCKTSCTCGVQENGAISLVVLQSTEILGLIICLAIHFLCVSIENYP